MTEYIAVDVEQLKKWRDSIHDSCSHCPSIWVTQDEIQKLIDLPPMVLAGYCSLRAVNHVGLCGSAILKGSHAEHEPLSDEEIINTCNAVDFSQMVTADDYIYMIARAIERKINGISSGHARAIFDGN